MNQKELLLMSVGVFLTIIAWMIIDVYHIQTRRDDSQMKPAPITRYNVDSDVFKVLKSKAP